MKTLSVKQPWASLICFGIKDVENRTWHTLYQGPILIHASLTPDRNAFAEFEGHLPKIEYTKGAIIGRVELVDVVRNSRSFWAETGCYHWVLANAVMFKEPIPVKGKLGLWEYEGK